jgi:hypothetical protein
MKRLFLPQGLMYAQAVIAVYRANMEACFYWYDGKL